MGLVGKRWRWAGWVLAEAWVGVLGGGLAYSGCGMSTSSLPAGCWDMAWIWMKCLLLQP